MFLYLIQCKSSEVIKQSELLDNINSIKLFLTWDYSHDDALFLPNSSWAEGRNLLIKEAKNLIQKNKLLIKYITIIDGDAIPDSKNWLNYQEFLEHKNMLMCIPRMEKSKCFERHSDKILNRKYQRALYIDEQVQSFRLDFFDLVSDYLYTKKFDDVCWWYSCEISQYTLRYVLKGEIIQYNDFSIRNDVHGNYPSNFENKYIFRLISDFGIYSKIPLIKNGCNFVRIRLIIDSLISLFYKVIIPKKSIIDKDLIERLNFIKSVYHKYDL